MRHGAEVNIAGKSPAKKTRMKKDGKKMKEEKSAVERIYDIIREIRVVTKDGNVSCAFSGGICNRQMELLKKEGVGFIDDHVDMRRFQWSKRLF